MEQAHDEKLMWMKRRQMMMMMSRSHDDDNSSWEDKAFAEDAAAGGGGGCIWPPRCYSCSFCKRQFRSAQALGGHMNVHRRDRARLKQQQRHSLTTLQQNLHTSLSCSRVSADQDSQNQQHHIMSPYIYKFSRPESEVENKSKREEEDEEHSRCLISSHEAETDLCVGLHSDRIGGACKRRKTSGTSGFSFLMVKPYCSFDHHMQYSEVIPAAAGAVEDIDLELRL